MAQWKYKQNVDNSICCFLNLSISQQFLNPFKVRIEKCLVWSYGAWFCKELSPNGANKESSTRRTFKVAMKMTTEIS